MNNVEIALSIFTVDKGEVKVLLVRKKEDPYKGYWQLPKMNLQKDSFELTIKDIIDNIAGLPQMTTYQVQTLTDFERNNQHYITISYMGVIDAKTVEIRSHETVEKSWFPIGSIPKTAYNYDEIIEYGIMSLKSKLVNSSVLKSLFPSDFTLPELQNVYEAILEKELDRRNFRKKFLTFDLIEDTGDKNEGFNGRPAKLYRFKDDIKEMDLF